MKVRLIFYFLFIASLLITSPSFSRDLATIKRSGKILVGMTKDDYKSINYDLVVEFAKYLNVEIVPVEITWEEAFMKNGNVPADLETNPSVVYNPDVFKKVDIICSTFTILEWRKKIFDFAETLNSAELLLINKNSPPVKDFSDLAGKTIALMEATSFEERMKVINEAQGGKIKIELVKTSEEAKNKLAKGEVFGIILDADEALNFNVTSDLKYRIGIPISPMTKTAWVVEKGNNLKKEVEDFFLTIENNEQLNNIFVRKFKTTYSKYIEDINKIILLEKHNHDLDMILEEGKLVVGLHNREFLFKNGGEKQFMYALAEEFADYLGISLEYLLAPDVNTYWKAEDNGIVRDSAYSPDWFGFIDVACEDFVPAGWQSKMVNFVPVFSSEYLVITRKDSRIRSIDDLTGLKCVTIKGSGLEEVIAKNNLASYSFERDTNLLELVQSGKADYTIIYDAFYQLSDYPLLESKFSLGKVDVNWALRKDQPKLQSELEKFISKSQKSGLIRSVLTNRLQKPETAIQQYYGNFQKGQVPAVLYGANEGLPQEDIFSIFQDRKGYMWFGTCSGAVRYNGREMKTIGVSGELTENRVRDIDQDSSGLIYLATSKGVIVIDKDTIVDKLLTDFSFSSIFIDRSDSKWFIGNKGIYILNRDGSTRYLNSEFPQLPTTVYNVDEETVTGEKYIATSRGVFVYSPQKNVLRRMSTAECFFVFIDRHSHLWMSTQTGLFVGALSDFGLEDFTMKSRNMNSVVGLDNDIIKDIRSDRYGSVWLVFDTKVVQMTSDDQSATVYDQKIGLKNNKILSSLFDKEDNLWVGFYGGLQRLSYKQGLRNFFPSVINSYVYSIQRTENGRLWIASNNGVFYYDNELVNFSGKLDIHEHEFVGHNQKYVLGKLPDNNLVFACSEGIYEVNPNTLAVVRKRMFTQFLLSPENIFVSSKREIVLLSGLNGTLYYLADFNSEPVTIKNEISSNISMLIEKNGKILGGNSNGLVELRNGKLSIAARTGCKVWSLYMRDSILWIGTDRGLAKIINGDYSNIQTVSVKENTVVKSICPANNRNYLWLGTNNGFAYFNTGTGEAELFVDSKDGLSGDEITPSGLYLESNDILWIGTYHGVSNFNIRARTAVPYPPLCYIERAFLNGNEFETGKNQSFRYNENNFVFEISAISFSDEKAIEFEFYIRGAGNKYSSYNKGKEFKAYYNNLPPGNYEFIYGAKGKNDVKSYSQKYVFTIRRAWFNTSIFRIFMIVVIAFLVWAIYRARVQKIEAQKKKLEQLVKERTAELEEANVEIEAQRDLAASQRDQIAEQNKEITDSIYYAERIQRSLLPPVIVLDMILPEHFILFKPKGIVSGDFYWAVEKNDKIFVSAVDCTGHGVPGALMSMLGISFLNEIVNNSADQGPEEVLNQLRNSIVKALKQAGQVGEARDGMDIGILVFDKAQKSISFAGANNPLYFIRNGELTEIKGDKMPVGIYENMTPFVKHTFEIQKGDAFYIFSDGYADQFGGPRAKKFMYSNFKNLLLSIQEKTMDEQGEILNEKIESWRGDLEQIDDIVVIGLRF
jgi:ligand-binding sensor domain-containing protein/serine phosphatase RsbU (regulator of sigma subunit)/ABC-type amino acid transport substrate-binding protein